MKSSIKSLWKGFIGSFRRFPVEALLAFTFLAISILGIEAIINEENVILGGDSFLIEYFFPIIVLCFCLHRYAINATKGRTLWKILYIASYFFWIPFIFVSHTPHWLHIFPHWLHISYLIILIMLIAGGRYMENRDFAVNATNTITKLVFVEIISWLIIGIISLIIFSIQNLFNLLSSDPASIRAYSYPILVIGIVIAPLICCHLISSEYQELKVKRFVGTVVNYILSPALAVYAIILLVYIIRILVKWELPQGGIVYMVCSFCAIALICKIIRTALDKTTFNWFYNYLPVIAAAPLVLLWVGIYRRVSEYGVTETRAYMIILAILITVFIAMLIKEKTRRYQVMAILLGLTLAIFTFIPYISAKDFGIRSQMARLDDLLPKVLIDNHFPQNINYSALNKDSVLAKTMLAAKSSYDFLYSNMEDEEFKSKYGDYGYFDLNKWEIKISESVRESTVNHSKIDIHNKQEIDLGEYTIYEPIYEYSFVRRQDDLLFLKFKDTLLKCNVRERWNTVDTSIVLSPETELYLTTYKNDEYMCLIRRLFIDTSSISAFEEHLFKKPKK